MLVGTLVVTSVWLGAGWLAGPGSSASLAAGPPGPPAASVITPAAPPPVDPPAPAAPLQLDDSFRPVGTQLVDVPVQSQLPELPNGCEVTSLAMLLAGGGVSVDRLALADAQETDAAPPVYAPGRSDFAGIVSWGNPHHAFVGSVRASGGIGLGIYHEPLARLATGQAPDRVVDLTGAGFATVVDQVRQGRPVMVWTTVTQTPVTDSQWVTWQTPQGPFTGTRQEHAVLVVGYDAQGLVINDPLSGTRKTVAPGPFITSWEQMGRQALTLRPPGARTGPAASDRSIPVGV